MKIFSLLILSSVLSINAFAGDCATKAPRGSEWKDCKAARPNASVDQYLLTTDGDLYAYINKIDRLCQVTEGVSDFKTSRHPKDAAVIYYARGGDLYVANEVKVKGQCPSMTKKMIMANVKKYNVVSTNNTTIVNTALSTSGRFNAWDNTKVVYSDILVEDYLLNTNYKVKGKSFNTFVAFTLGYDHYITKVKGSASDESSYIKSTETNRSYKSIQEFKKSTNLE